LILCIFSGEISDVVDEVKLMFVALESVDIAVVDHDLLLVREAHITMWNAVARGVIRSARLLRSSVLYSPVHSA